MGYEAFISKLNKMNVNYGYYPWDDPNDRFAADAMKVLREKGYIIPEDISIVGCDDALEAGFTRPSLTTIRVKTEEMGMQSAKILLNMITKKFERLVDEIKFLPELIVRESTARISI